MKGGGADAGSRKLGRGFLKNRKSRRLRAGIGHLGSFLFSPKGINNFEKKSHDLFPETQRAGLFFPI